MKRIGLVLSFALGVVAACSSEDSGDNGGGGGDAKGGNEPKNTLTNAAGSIADVTNGCQ